MSSEQPDLLRGLTKEQMGSAMALGSHMRFASGDVLFHLGDPASSLFLIERGKVRLTLPMTVQGREEDIFVEERSAGQAVGWSALIPPYRFTLKATALLDTEVVSFDREALQTFFSENPDLGYLVSFNFAAVIGQRLQLFQAMWMREIQRLVELRCA